MSVAGGYRGNSDGISVTFDLKILLRWYTDVVVLFPGGVGDSLVDIAASLTNLLVVRYRCNPQMMNIRLVTVAESLAALARKVCFISRFGVVSVFDQYPQNLGLPTPRIHPGVGIGVTVIALICTIILVTFQRWVVRKTQKSGGTGGYASLSV